MVASGALGNLGSPNNICCEGAPAPHTTNAGPARAISSHIDAKSHEAPCVMSKRQATIHIILEEFGSHVRRIRRGS